MARPTYSLEGGKSRNIGLVDFYNSAASDSFGRLRVSSPSTLYDSKAITDASAINLFYDDVEFSGGGTSSTYSEDRASFTLEVSNTTAGKRVRQTKQRFNYQPGKSQLILMTGAFGAGATGITKRVGYFDENNGLGLKIDENGTYFFIRSSVTGSPVDTEIISTAWGIDNDFPESNIDTLNLDKTQIFFIDFEWLGVGSVRFGFVIDGIMRVCYQRNNANVLDAVYMSTPNLPLRYEIENDGTGAADSLEVICASVMSEGGQEDTGITHYVSNGGTKVDADSAGTLYALVGVRLKSTHLDSVVKIIETSVLCNANPNFEWLLVLNPTVAGSFSYSSLANSSIEYATGATANTVTGGTTLDGGYTTNNISSQSVKNNLYYLGSTIAGTSDQIVLCARPLQAAADIFGGIKIREYS